MSKHAPRGPIKARDPLAGADPLPVPSGLKRGNRCSAKSKRSGKPCTMPAIAGGTVCRMHGGAAPQVRQAALERLMAYQDRAIDRLFGLVEQEAYPSTAMQAVKDVLDRTMGKPHESVSLTGKDDGPLEIVIRKPWGKAQNH
jgi:hypothetical protein